MRTILRNVGPALAACWIILGCNATMDVVEITPASMPIATDRWQIIAPGIERRDSEIALDGGANARAALLRLDPGIVRFEAHYSPGAPYPLTEWGNILSHAAVIINGAFFDEFDRAIGLLVSNGQVFGQTLTGYGGMFEVTAAGPRVRSLVSEPYQGEALTHAVQAFPMLIEAGGVMAPRDSGFDMRSRRTIVGQDTSGRIVFVVIPRNGISFAEAQDWLLASDLNLHIALALDGGRSSGLVVNTPNGGESFPSAEAVPNVNAVYGS